MTDQRSPQWGRGRARGSLDDAGKSQADPESLAKEACIRALAIKARTRQELVNLLVRKGFEPDVTERVVNRLEQLHLVDDAQFAHDWVEQRQRHQHRSARALRQELQAKGVDRDTVDAAVAGVGDSGDLAAAVALVEKKLRSASGGEPEVVARRVLGMLARRGFSLEVSRRALESCLGSEKTFGVEALED